MKKNFDQAPSVTYRYDVTDSEAVRSAREATIGDTCHVQTQPGTDDHRSRLEHLRHTCKVQMRTTTAQL